MNNPFNEQEEEIEPLSGGDEIFKHTFVDVLEVKKVPNETEPSVMTSQ
jgi:hypothetical protein